METTNNNANDHKNAQIPETPEQQHPEVQTSAERRQRLNDWKRLLEALPYIDIVKADGETNPGYVNDNPELFQTSQIVVEIFPIADYPDDICQFVYFAFDEDGKRVSVEAMGSLVWHPEFDDHMSNTFREFIKENEHGIIAETWKEGYEELVRFLEEAFGKGIPPAPGTE